MPQPIAAPPPFIFELLRNVGSPIAILSLLYAWGKDQTRDAKSRQILETARNRMAFWDARFKLQSLALQGAELETAKLEALKAADEIKQRADAQLNQITWKPTRRKDLPRWQRYTLFYRPDLVSRGGKIASYIARVGYWSMACSFVFFLLAIPARIAWLYFHELPQTRVADIGEFTSHPHILRAFAASIFLLFGVILFNGIIFYFSARNEGERPKVEPLQLTRI